MQPKLSRFFDATHCFHQHFNPGKAPARYLALKPWGFKFKVEDLKDTGEDVKKGGAQIEYERRSSPSSVWSRRVRYWPGRNA